jgi:Tol biopolymer transport system component
MSKRQPGAASWRGGVVLLSLLVAPIAHAQVFPGNDNSFSASLSGDGRYVAFYSLASNLVPGDTNGVEDVFLLDRQSDTLRRISVNAFGGQADGQSWLPVITPDARYVVFVSNASNLVAGDTNNGADVFRVDTTTGVVERASLSSSGAQAVVGQTDISAPSISADGRFVAFAMTGSGLVPSSGSGSYVRDMDKDRTYFIATNFGFQGGKPAVASLPVMGGTEVRIAYQDGPGTLPEENVYLDTFVVPDSQLSTDPDPAVTTRLVSAACTAAPCNGTTPGNGRSGAFDDAGFGIAISSDGDRIAFVSAATNLAPGDVDANNLSDVYVHFVAGQTTTRESDGMAPNLGTSVVFPVNIAPDGSRVIYFSQVSGNWIVKEVDAAPTSGATTVGTGSPSGSRLEVAPRGAVSDAGNFAAFPSSDDLVTIPRNDTRTDVFVRFASTTTLVSRGRVGTSSDGHSRVPAISADGRYVAFSSYASGFGGGDAGANRDVFRRSLVDGTVDRVSAAFGALQDSRFPDISGDGSRVVFLSLFGTASCPEGGNAFIWRAGPPATVACIDADANGFTGLAADQFTQPAISDDGRWAAFTGRENFGRAELYVRDLDPTTATILTKVEPNTSSCSTDCGLAGFEDETYQLSGDGRYLVFTVRRGLLSLYEIQIWDRLDPLTPAIIISRFAGGNAIGGGKNPSISSDGNLVAFISSDNLTNEAGAPSGDKVFVWNRNAIGTLPAGSLTRVRGETIGRAGATHKARTRISGDGRYVVYVQDDVCVFRCASNTREIAIFDRIAGSLRTVSLTPSWGGANGPSGVVDDIGIDTFLFSLDIDGDGRKVVFGSSASNLAPDDRNAADDVFLVDVPSQTIALVSGAGSNTAGDLDRLAPALNSDGTVLAMAVKDRDGARAAGGEAAVKAFKGGPSASKFSDIAINGAGQSGERIVSQAPGGAPASGDSGEPAISGDGSSVVYTSGADNLSLTADPNGVDDIYLYDVASNSNVLVSRGLGGIMANGPSSDASVATLAPPPGAKGPIGDKWSSSFTTGATNMGSAPDANNASDVMVADEGDAGQPPSVEPVSVNSQGQLGNAPSGQSSIAEGGDLVTFASLANNLSNGDDNGTTDIFMRDRNTDQTIMISASQQGAAGNGPSSNPIGDKWGSGTQPPGQSNVQWVVAFESDASNLVSDDLNGASDVFARFSNGTVKLISRGLNGVTAAGASSAPSLSNDGRFVSFVSTASNLIAGDTNNLPDVFTYDLLSDQIMRVSVGSSGQEPDDIAVSTSVATGLGGEPVVTWDTPAQNLGNAPDVDNAFDVYFRSGDDPSGAIQSTLTGTAITVTSDGPDASVAGQPYTVNYSATTGGGPAQGRVVVRDGAGGVCGPLLTNPQGQGSCILTSLRAGAKTLTAEFVPQQAFVFAVSSDTEAHTVDKANTSVSLTPQGGPLLRGNPFTVTIGVSVIAPGAGTPTGNVTVSADTGESCVATLPATSCLLTVNTVGARTLTASYAGSVDFNTSSAQAGATILQPGEIILSTGFED